MEDITQNPALNEFLQKYDKRDWNEVIWPKLHGLTPMKEALKSFDKNAMEKLGLNIILPNDICLTPELIK